MKRSAWIVIVSMLVGASSLWASAEPAQGFYHEGMDLYQAGRTSEAIDSFEEAIKHRDHAKESQSFIDRIRHETVERIRNKALTGVSKNSWQTPFYYVNQVNNRVRVGISSQEVFDRGSVNFRPQAVDALQQLSDILRHSNNAVISIELINEVPQEGAINPEIVAQQVNAVFCFLAQRSNTASTAE